MSHAPGRQTKAGGKPRQNKSPAHSHKSSAFNPVPPVVRGSDITYHGQYLAFYGSRGPLSNFYTGKPFRGSQAVQYLLDRLTELNLPDLYMPARDSIAVEIMSEHQFTCGEQFLMACKGFLFEFPHISVATQAEDQRVASLTSPSNRPRPSWTSISRHASKTYFNSANPISSKSSWPKPREK